MRDLILAAVLLGILPLIFRAPIVGVLAWIWIALMNPQRQVYGFLYGFELNFYVAVITAIAWLASKERKSVPLNAFTVLLVVFAAWTSLTTVTALDRAFSFGLWDRTIKSIVLAVLVIMIANTKARIQAVLWMVVLSLGYYGIKGGGFAVMTGGREHVYGPVNTMIEDNNALGLALIFILPLLDYLRATSRSRVVRAVAVVALLSSVGAVLSTYSRGALVALGAAAGVYAMRSRAGGLVLLAGVILAIAVPLVAPPTWLARMSSIQSAHDDASFQGRVEAWKTSVAIAKARPTGGGFSSVERDKVAKAFPTPGGSTHGRAAHSIYFEVLGDHGFIGLALYLLVIGSAGLNTVRVQIVARGRPDLAWADLLAKMLQVSMVALLVGGSALSVAYYDGFLVVLALTASLLQVVNRPAEQPGLSPSQPRWRQAATLDAPRTAA